MARLLVTHPYHLALDPREVALGRPYPPLSTLVVAAALREAGHEVVFHDPMFLPDEGGFAQVVSQARPDAVMVLADDHSVQIKQCLARVRQAAQAMARVADVPVLVAGPDVSDRSEEYLAAGAAAAVVGDCAEAAVEWARGGPSVPGVHGLRGAGGRRPVITDLGRLPFPAWDLVDMAGYARAWRTRHGVWEANVWTTRGCPYKCNWCAKPTWGRTANLRPPEAVAAEISMLRLCYAPDRLWMTDDIFALRGDWLRRFRALVTREATPLPFRCLSRADLLCDAAYVDDLAAAGCDEVWLGAESGSDRILAAMDKGSTVAEIRRASRNLQGRGVRVGFFLQLGYPGETLQDVQATVRMVEELRPSFIGVSVSYPLPGTVFHAHVAGSLKGSSWTASMDNRTLYEAPFADAFYAVAKELLRSTHSAGRATDTLRAFFHHPGRRTGRRVAGAAFHAARLPLVRWRLERAAVPNPDAVPLTW